MLVLGRKAGQKIMIGDNIVVSVLSAQGSQFRIGIDAPPDVAVHREEIYEKIKYEISTQPKKS